MTTLYHYTFADRIQSIVFEGLRPSIQIPGERSSDAQHGNGQYFTDLTPDEAANFTRPQVSQALFQTPRKWGISGQLRPIGWIEFGIPTETVQRVHNLFASKVAQAYPQRGIWLHESRVILPPSLIKHQGMLVFQPMPNGNR